MKKQYLTGGDVSGILLQSALGSTLSTVNALTGNAADPLQQQLNKKIGEITNQNPEILKTAEQANQAQNQMAGLGIDALKMFAGFKDGGSITEMFTKAYSHGGKLDYPSLEAIGVTKRQANKAYKDFLTKYESGGSLMPFNPDHLEKESENLVQYDGPDHPQGGIKTPSGEFNLQETVLKAGKLSDTPYAFSDINVLDKSTAEQLGLDTKHVGKTMAEISKSIEKKYEVKFNDDDTKAKTKQLMSEDLYSRLMEANETMLLKAKAKQAWDSKPNYGAMSQEEFNDYMCGGKVKEYQGGSWVDDEYPTKPKTYFDPLKTTNYRETTEYPVQYAEKPKLFTDPPTAQRTAAEYDEAFYNELAATEPTSFMEAALGVPEKFDFKVDPVQYGGIKDPVKTDATTSEVKAGMSNQEKIGLGLKGLSQLGEIASTLGKKQDVAVQRNPYASQVSQLMRDRYVDMTPIQDQIASSARAAYENLAGTNSQVVNAALGQGISNQSMAQMSQAKLQAQQLNNGYKGDLARTLNNLGQQDVAAKNYQENLQAQTDANVNNVRREALGNIGNDLGNYFIAKDVVKAKTAEERAFMIQKVKLENMKIQNPSQRKENLASMNELIVKLGGTPIEAKEVGL